MSITLYSGTPGSGKSYHAACDIWSWLRRSDRGLITNFPLNGRILKKRQRCRFDYVDNRDLTVDFLVDYASMYHKTGVERQTLVIIDEAQVLFNARTFASSDRQKWCTFFSQHRKFGFDFVLIAQYDRMLDRQIRCLLEYEVRHRKLNNYGFGGFFLSAFTGFATWFVAIQYWYGGNSLKLDSTMLLFQQKKADIYNSYELFTGGGLLT